MKTPDTTTRLLEASIRLQKIIKAKQQLISIGGCEDAIEKLDVKIFHLSGIRERHIYKSYAQEQRIEQAII